MWLTFCFLALIPMKTLSFCIRSFLRNVVSREIEECDVIYMDAGDELLLETALFTFLMFIFMLLYFNREYHWNCSLSNCSIFQSSWRENPRLLWTISSDYTLTYDCRPAYELARLVLLLFSVLLSRSLWISSVYRSGLLVCSILEIVIL